MFGKYFGATYFSPSYWGTGDAFTGGGPKTKRKLSKAEIDGLKVIYPEAEILPEIEYEVSEVDVTTERETITGIDISVLERESALYDRVLSLTQVEKREVLQETDDIGLILAIIEAME